MRKRRGVLLLCVLPPMLAVVAAPVAAQTRARAIRETMRRAVPALRQCYERSLRSGEDPGGPYALEIHVERSGRVSHARFSGAEQRAPRFARCATRAMKRLRFPRQSGRLVIRYPLNVDAFP